MKNHNIKISLIITTYNRPDMLRVCLESVQRQCLMPDEVIIADDGSTDETRQLIDGIRAEFEIPLKHVWHEDKGFRRAAILNAATREANDADFIIYIDGDVILHEHFIDDYARMAEPGYYIFGRAVYLNKSISEAIIRGEILRPSFWQAGVAHRENMLYLPKLSWLTERYKRSKVYGGGRNFGTWRFDIIMVNGYDEDYEGWGYEDNDLIIRLRNTGLISKAAKFQAIEYHLWHKKRPANNTNIQILKQTINNISVRCRDGLFKTRPTIS